MSRHTDTAQRPTDTPHHPSVARYGLGPAELLIAEDTHLKLPGPGEAGQRLRYTQFFCPLDGADICAGDAHSGDFTARAPALLAHGNGQPLSVTTSGRCVILRLPLYLTPTFATLYAPATRVCDWPAAELLGENIAALAEVIDSLDDQARLYQLAALADLTDALLDTHEPAPEKADAVRAQQHLDRHLGQADLSLDGLRDSLALPRARALALFKPFGGFKTYLRSRRLDRVAAQLTRPGQYTASIKQRLFEAGFNSHTQFQRQFKERFGLTARELENGAAPPNLTRYRLND